METLRWVFLDDEGRVRSGWGILAFFVVSFATGALLVQLVRGPALTNLAPLAALLLGTWGASLLVRQPIGEAGFRDSRWATHVAAGFGLGALLVALMVAVPWAAGREALAGPTVGTHALVGAGAPRNGFLAPPPAPRGKAGPGGFLRPPGPGAQRPAAWRG